MPNNIRRNKDEFRNLTLILLRQK